MEPINPEEMQKATDAEFVRFFNESPFGHETGRIRIAMNGSFLAGFIFAQKILIKLLQEKFDLKNPKKTDSCQENTQWSEEHGLIQIDTHEWVEIEDSETKNVLKCSKCSKESIGLKSSK